MRRWAAVAVALSLSACMPAADLPKAPMPYGPAIRVDAQAVPLDPTDPGHTAIGNFAYAGGIWITSSDTARLHGLSDLKVWPDGRMMAMSDQSDLLQAQIVLDAAGKLVGLTDARLIAMKDEHGVDLYAGGQKEFDSEGFAELPSGDMVVAFEQHDRVLLFPKGGGLPRPAPLPQIKYVFNQGIEAMVADPKVGPDAYRVGIEATGETFRCRVSAGCEALNTLDLEGLKLSAFDLMPGGGMAYLARDYKPGFGNTMRLIIVDRMGARVDSFELKPPLTLDNMEGLAALPMGGGRIRFYLIADDNFGVYAKLPTFQRELMLAFDWTAAKGRMP